MPFLNVWSVSYSVEGLGKLNISGSDCSQVRDFGIVVHERACKAHGSGGGLLN
jgi:hypothetical protein